MAIETKQLHALSKVYLEAVYGGAKKEAPKDTRLTVTAADKKANTKAYQNYKAGNKAYKAADHLKNESLSNWREDLGLLDENRAAAYTAGMSPEQKAVEMRKISPKVADDAGRAHDKFMFGSRKKGGKENRKYEKEIRKSIPSDKPNRNKTGRGMPVSYRDSYEKDRDDVIQSKIRQGKGSFKDLGKKK